jgi:hypothetical protein
MRFRKTFSSSVPLLECKNTRNMATPRNLSIFCFYGDEHFSIREVEFGMETDLKRAWTLVWDAKATDRECLAIVKLWLTFNVDWACSLVIMYKRVKLSLYRPIEVQEVKTPKISRQSAHEGGKVVSPTHQPLLPLRENSWYAFVLGAESTPIGHRTRYLPACSAVSQTKAVWALITLNKDTVYICMHR